MKSYVTELRDVAPNGEEYIQYPITIAKAVKLSTTKPDGTVELNDVDLETLILNMARQIENLEMRLNEYEANKRG